MPYLIADKTQLKKGYLRSIIHHSIKNLSLT